MILGPNLHIKLLNINHQFMYEHGFFLFGYWRGRGNFRRHFSCILFL